MSSSRQLGTILLVENCEDEIYLLGRTLKREGLFHLLQVARTGRTAMEYLKPRVAEGRGAHRPSGPSLVIIDTKLPDMTGPEVLHRIRAETATGQLRVYLMSHSRLQLEIAKAHCKGADGYWVKPVNVGEYAALAGRIKDLLFQESDPGIESR